jgi:hypothetical protein
MAPTYSQAFCNNRGGVGKTFMAFQTACEVAPNSKPRLYIPNPINPAPLKLLHPSPSIRYQKSGNAAACTPIRYTLHPAPCTLHPYILHPTLYTMHHAPTADTPCAPHPTLYTLPPTPYSQNLNPAPCTLSAPTKLQPFNPNPQNPLTRP